MNLIIFKYITIIIIVIICKTIIDQLVKIPGVKNKS